MIHIIDEWVIDDENLIDWYWFDILINTDGYYLIKSRL